MSRPLTGMGVTFVLRRDAKVFERPTIEQLLSKFIVFGAEGECFCNLVHTPDEEKELINFWWDQHWEEEDAVYLANEEFRHVKWSLPSYKEIGYGNYSRARLGTLYLQQHTEKKHIYKSAECRNISFYLSECLEYCQARGLDFQSKIRKFCQLFEECGEDSSSFIQVC